MVAQASIYYEDNEYVHDENRYYEFHMEVD